MKFNTDFKVNNVIREGTSKIQGSLKGGVNG